MSLRRKVILSVVGATLLTVLAGWAAVRLIAQEGFRRIDQERAARDLSRAAGALDSEILHLDSALVFKSSSDITYRFAADRDKRLAANYFSWEALRTGNLNLMALFDTSGELVAGAAFDLSTREAIPLDKMLDGLPKRIRQPGSSESAGGKGLIMTPHGPMLISYKPVLNSMGWGPSRGTLLAGRFLSAGLIQGIGQRLGLDLSAEPISQAPADISRAASKVLRTGEEAVPGQVTPDSLTLHGAYPDFLGTPALLLTLKHPRVGILPYRQTVLLALLFVGLAGTLAFAMSFFLLRRDVLTPLERITRHIQGIRDGRDLGKPLAMGGTGEIGLLADAFDSMGADLSGLYDQLDRQHGLLRLLIDNIPHPISVKDAQGRYVVANRALAELLGTTPARVPGLSDSGLASPMAWAAHARVMEQEVLQTGEPRLTPAEPFDQPGRESRFFDTSRLLLPDPDGRDGQVLTVSLDVTERLKAEDGLRRSEHRFRSLFETMTEGVCLHEFITGTDGRIRDYRILDVNAAYERILSIPKNAAIGRLASELYGGGEPPFLDVYAQVGVTGVAKVFETYFAPMDKHFHISAFSPDPGYFATVFQDTTERIRTQEALEQARVDIQHILDSMPSPVIGLDANRHVVHMNAAAAALTPLQDGQAAGRSLADSFPQLAGQLGTIDDALREGRPSVVRRLRIDMGGEERLADLEVYPMIEDGQARGAVVRLDDVTERVRMEEVVLQSEKMMSVGGLAAGMAHEINNPLGGILQCVQIIKRRLQDGLPGNVRAAQEAGCSLDSLNAYLDSREITHFLNSIQDAGTRAARIVANMLEFSRRSESRLAPCELTVILEKTLELAANDYDLRKKFDFRRIQIVREFESGLPPVRCTQTELEQVVLNLIKNAAQAMAGHTKDGTTPVITLRLLQDGEFARIEVQDNGPGIPEDIRKRVFEPFFTTKSPGLGTGLGLSVSYFIITRNHGGTLSVDSAPGQGARFIVRIPFAPPGEGGCTTPACLAS